MFLPEPAASGREQGTTRPADQGMTGGARLAGKVDVQITAGTPADVPRSGNRGHVQGAPGVFEMTWAKDGRATWQYGPEQRPGTPHVIWRRIGGHAIFGLGPLVAPPRPSSCSLRNRAASETAYFSLFQQPPRIRRDGEWVTDVAGAVRAQRHGESSGGDAQGVGSLRGRASRSYPRHLRHPRRGWAWRSG